MFPNKDKFDTNAQSGIYEKPKENPNIQNNIYSKIKNPYQNYISMNNTFPIPHSIHMSNINPNVPPYAQTQIPMNPFIRPYDQTQIPMTTIPIPFGHPLHAPYQPEININKKYNVNISTGDLGNILHIYQDMLPKNNSKHPDRYATISERLNISNYYGLIFNKHYNHHNENFTSGIANTKMINDSNLSYLLGHIKINNFNSYYSTGSLIERLPAAPPDFFMFDVCCPIAYNNTITCGEDGTRSQMRIYKLFNIDTQDPNERNALNKVAIELLYYRKIQEFIKNKKYPNFILLYGAIFTNCNIDFERMKYLRNINDLLRVQYNKNKNNNCLLMLTESVNYNIIEWMSKQYDKADENNNFYVSKVVSSGVRSEEAWKSVIFQLLVAIHILHKNKIGFKNFSLKDNVFIKKIDITPPVIKYWKYIIGEANYYVPNHGFLVMIDSNFKDHIVIDNQTEPVSVSTSASTAAPAPAPAPAPASAPASASASASASVAVSAPEPPPLFPHKYAEINISEIIKNIFEELVNKTDVTIPGCLRDIFNKIRYNPKLNIENIINNNFHEYLYEKLGHMIPISYLNEYYLDHDKDFKVGDLVFYKKYPSVYIISSYIGKKNKKSNSHEIFTNDSELNKYNENSITLSEKSVSRDLITKFRYKSNKEVIETYIM